MDGYAKERLAFVIDQLMDGRSQGSFAREFGVKQPTIHAWLHGYSFPDLNNLEKIANLYGMQLEDFVAYLRTGDLTHRDPFDRLVEQVKALPCTQFAQLLRLAADKLERVS